MAMKFFKALLCALLGVLCFPAFAQNTIKIGSVLSLTGPADYLGDNALRTFQLYIDKINASGGVLDKKLELVVYDDGSDANKANSFVKRLIESDQVDLLIGGSTTGTTMAMVPLVEKVGIPFISLGGAGVIVDPVKHWVFKISQTDRMIAERVLEDMKKRNITRIGLLSETTGYGQSGRKEVLALAPEYGITLGADETYGAKDTDMTVQLTRIKAVQGLEAVFVFGVGQAPAIVTKNYRQLGIKMPLYHAAGVASGEFLTLAREAAEGVRLPSPALLVASELPENDPQKVLLLDFQKAYKERYGMPPNTFGGYAYDALMLAVDAMNRAKSTERNAVRDAIEKTSGLVDTAGVIHMSPTDHLGIDMSGFRMIEVYEGRWRLLK